MVSLGSVLGPLLFNIYVTDVPDIVSCDIKMLADDTNIRSILLLKFLLTYECSTITV